MSVQILRDADDKPIRCDGDTFLGFTKKSCPNYATRELRNGGKYEVYYLCEHHYWKQITEWEQARYAPKDKPKNE